LQIEAPIKSEPVKEKAIEPNEIAVEQPKPEVTKPIEPSRTKTTINLGNILKPINKPIEVKEEVKIIQAIDRPIDANELKQVWNEYAETRKDQLAEYHLLKRGFEASGKELIISITNPVEEPLLLSIKTNLVTHLREKLGNSTIQVQGLLKLLDNKRVAYTNKEKFDSLASKNPLLIELRDKFGLDPDF
jgi:hypothetical protein